MDRNSKEQCWKQNANNVVSRQESDEHEPECDQSSDSNEKRGEYGEDAL
jgi:hypothetical protein